MEKNRTKDDRCVENDEIYEIGEQWTDHNNCSLKTCQPGGHISVKLCPPLDLSSGCSKIEGDFNQEFPQCCPDLECSRDEPSSESSSSSSSDVDEEDLFDGDGDMDVFNFEDPSNETVDESDDNSSKTKIDLEADNSKVLYNSKDQMKKVLFEDNQPHKIIIVQTNNKNMSDENVSDNTKESINSLKSNEVVLRDITNRGGSTNHEPPSHLERHTETQKHIDTSEDKYNKGTSETSKDAAGTTEDTVVTPQSIDVNKTMDSISDNKTLVSSTNTLRENETKEYTDQENSDLTNLSQSNGEDSMDNINYSARELYEKTEKSFHTTQAMAEHLETPQYKIIDYLDDIQDDPRFKELNDSENATDEVLKNKHELSSISIETRQNVLNDENMDNKTPFEDDIYHTEESNFLVEKSSENTREEDTDKDNVDASEVILYKTESTDGVVYNPDDSEGFLINPKDNIIVHNSYNETVSESTTDPSSDQFEESSQLGLRDKISYDLEELDNIAKGNYDEGSNGIIGNEEMLNMNEEIDVLKHNDNSEEFASTNIPLDTILDTDTKIVSDINIEEPLIEHESIESNLHNENNEDSEEFVENNENTGSINDQILEENQITDFTGSHYATAEDNVSVNSFDMKVEDHLSDNEDDFENVDGDHEITAVEYQDLPGYVDAENQFQDFEEPIQSAETFQNAEEEEEEADYNPAQDFEEVNPSELAEEETNYTTTEQSSPVEGSSESTTEVTDVFEETNDDIDD